MLSYSYVICIKDAFVIIIVMLLLLLLNTLLGLTY